MAIQLSNRVGRIKPSPTLAVTARASELKAQGKDILSLGAGEPDFDTPDHIKQAAIQALKDGKTKYTPVDGIPSLKEAICEKFAQDNQLLYSLNQVIVGTGGKQCIFNLLQATLNDGDEVIIPAPYWVSYPDMTLLAGGIPVIVESQMENRFKITPDQLEAAITPRTKMVFINSPSNPSGMCYTQNELFDLAQVLLKHPDVLIASDDMYEYIVWPGNTFSNMIMAEPKLYDRTIILSGVSKAYSMTGWRIGYAAGPEVIIKAMKKIQSQSTSNPCSIAQAAAQAAIEGSKEFVTMMVSAFKERHDYVVDALNQMPGITCAKGDGTFYVFPKVDDVLKKLKLNTDTELAEYLIEKAGVALVPGSAFGTPGYLRLSFATSMQSLEEAMKRLSNSF